MKVLAILGVTVALALGGVALVLALDARDSADRTSRAVQKLDKPRPILEVRQVERGPYVDGVRIRPGQFEGTNVVCPEGFTVVGGGVRIAGPVVTTTAAPDGHDIYRVDGYNATSSLSTGTELGRAGGVAVCVPGAGGLRVRYLGGGG